MGWFIRGSTVAIAVIFAALAMPAIGIAAPGIGTAQCQSMNMSWNEGTGECTQPPPPPPRPWWSPNAPMWSVGFHQWGAYFDGVWVPY
ncbi:hypothetical protein [Mycobacterium stomatepiae]|nr:hypothetical protein [Mycobacterium stomatepiae]MCV7167365.1 hypothetical protein [Mycobacterium stomatepiae]